MKQTLKKGFSLAELGIAMVILLIVSTIATISYFAIIDNAKEVKVVEEAKTIRLSLARQGIDIKDYSTPVVYDELDSKVKELLEYHLKEGTNLIGTVFQNKAILKDGEYVIGELRAKSSDLNSTVLLDLLNIVQVKAEDILEEICVRQLDNNAMNKIFTEDFSGDWFIVERIGNCSTVDGNEDDNEEATNKFVKEVEQLTEVPKGYTGIYTVEDLNNMRNNTSGSYILMDNLDLSEYENWEPVGNGSDIFTGTFNGNNYIIKNMKIDTLKNLRGLFGVTSGATILNIGIEDSTIKGSTYVGGLIGMSIDTSIENSYFKGYVEGNGDVGGLIGRNEKNSNIKFSYTEVDVKGTKSNVGGLVGYNYNNSKIEHSYSIGNIIGISYTGGLVGSSQNSTTISNSFAKGYVEGDYSTGGLVGYIYFSSIFNSYANADVNNTDTRAGGLVGYLRDTTVKNTYSRGLVTGNNDYLGGLIGYNDKSSLLKSYWDKQASGQEFSKGGEGKTTEEMKQVSNYTDWNKEILDDGITPVWILNEGEYPKLWFEK